LLVDSAAQGRGKLKVTVRASTGARFRVWREDELFHVRPADSAIEPQICVGVDLFEVIAELAGLNLEDREQSVEAMRLALDAQRALGMTGEPSGNSADASAPAE
jgi:hypothetical protein